MRKMQQTLNMWLRALSSVPLVSKEEWESLDIISKWLIASRASFFPITIISCVIGGLWAYREGAFQLFPWLIGSIGFTLAHASANLLNDFLDYIFGVDTGDYFRVEYASHPLEHRLMELKNHFLYFFFTFLPVLFAGIYLVYIRGVLASYILIGEIFFIFFYTYPLKHYGLGEPAIFITWGPLIVGGTYLIASGDWSWQAVAVSLPHALGVTSILMCDHLDKYPDDKAKNVGTLPVIIGERNGRFLVLFLMISQYLSTIYLVSTGIASPFLLLVFLAFPTYFKVVKIFRSAKPEERPSWYRADVWPLWFLQHAISHTLKFGTVYLLALIIDVVFTRIRVF